jgi:hypothetical protein
MEKYTSEELELITLTFNKMIERTDDEYNNTANPWFACLGARIIAIDRLGKFLKNSIDKNYEPFKEEIKKIKIELQEFKKKYPTKDAKNSSESTVPRTEIKEFIRKMEDLKKFL